MSELLQAAKLLIESWDTGFDSPDIEDDFRAAVKRAESRQPVRLSDEEIENLFEENPIGKYPRIAIARAIEKGVLEKNQ